MDKLNLFKQYPMTSSAPEFLAGVYGAGTDLNTFSKCLPQAARIVDVGAGLSTFGAAVAARRPDIRWTNFDLNYSGNHISNQLLQAVMETAPENVRYVAGDVLTLTEDMKRQYDLLFSYNLLPHLLRVDRIIGRTALRNMVGMLNENGMLMTGPVSDKVTDVLRRQVCELSAQATDTDVANVADALTSPRLADTYHNAVWRSGVAAYPGDRFGADHSSTLVLSDDGGHTAHQIASVQGVKLAGRLLGGVMHIHSATKR